jgi:H+-translocating NAD(P) transhydrogenase subunit alpha
MLIAAPAETDPGETRVAASPETVKKFAALGAEVAVELGAGDKAGFPTPTISRLAHALSRLKKRSAPIWC